MSHIRAGSLRILLVAALAVAPACSFYSSAVHWNGRVGPDGHPVFVRTSTNLGLNLLVILPIVGRTSIDEMIDDMTASIAKKGGDKVRVFETTRENYWYGFAPVTWFLTPVITDVSVEYRPSAEEIAEWKARDDAKKETDKPREH
jgi:hypothetical protein